jgi:hypothetical protein
MTTAKQEAERLTKASGRVDITRRTIQKYRQGRKAATERVKNALAIINKE